MIAGVSRSPDLERPESGLISAHAARSSVL